MKQTRIAIIGAGIGGLTLALALQRAGFRVSVYEQAPQLGEVGAGLTISPNATHALEFVGMGPVLESLGDKPADGCTLHYRTGDVLLYTQRHGSFHEQYGAHYYQIHRADMHDALAEAVRANDPGAIHLGHVFAGVIQNDAAVTATFTNGVSIKADALIGADGIKSVVRTALFGAEAPRFTGQVAFRGMVPADQVARYMQPAPSAVSIGPGHTFTRYYIRHKTLVNFVGLTRTQAWREEGWSIPATADEMLAEYEGWHPGVPGIIKATPPGKLFKWALFDRDPLPRWTVGKVTLLGDAAHPMLPFLGLGAATALEDAVVMARCFMASGSVPEVLARYEAARRELATNIFLDSRRQAEIHQSRDPDKYAEAGGRSELRLKYFGYNPATAPV